MSLECPSCRAARERQQEAGIEGWLHPSTEYPSLLHCNSCGEYYEQKGGFTSRTLVKVDPADYVRGAV